QDERREQDASCGERRPVDRHTTMLGGGHGSAVATWHGRARSVAGSVGTCPGSGPQSAFDRRPASGGSEGAPPDEGTGTPLLGVGRSPSAHAWYQGSAPAKAADLSELIIFWRPAQPLRPWRGPGAAPLPNQQRPAPTTCAWSDRSSPRREARGKRGLPRLRVTGRVPLAK